MDFISNVQPSIKSLDISGNNVGIPGIQSLSKILVDTTFSLQELDLSNNALADRATIILMNALKENNTLTKLDISKNKIGITGMRAVSSYLCKSTVILMLSLSWNEIYGIGALEFADAIKV